MSDMDITHRLSDRVRRGERLSDEELGALAAADILSLGMLADEARRARAGTTVEYIRVHAFDPARPAAVPDAADEVRIVSLPDTRDAAIETVRQARAAAGSRRVTAFSWTDVARQTTWGGLSGLLADLAAAGLSDLVRYPADAMDDVGGAVGMARRAGLTGGRLSIDHPPGRRLLDVLAGVRAVAETAGGLLVFAPLATYPAADVPTTGYEDLRAVALARLALNHLETGGGPPAIEVDWLQFGPKLAQVALTFGADRLDAVPAADDTSLGPRRATVADLERNIRAAGFEPGRRRQARA